MQREALLAKEAKYEHGLKRQDSEYDEILHTIRENNNSSRNGAKDVRGILTTHLENPLSNSLFQFQDYVALGLAD